MKLSERQIDQLFTFTQKHYVDYYDVQVELVDHLANDIEKIWSEQPDLTFEQARDQSFKKFGVFGFYEIVQKKENEMTKAYFKLIFRFVKEWFQLPKLILTALLFFVFYQIRAWSFGYYVYAYMTYAIVIAQFIYLIVKGVQRKKKEKKGQKKWLFEQVLTSQGIGGVCVILFVFFDYPTHNAEYFATMGTLRSLYSTFVFTCIVLVGYVTLFVIPNRAQQLLKETYSEYEIA